jgi:hypothetical protein
MESLTLHSAAPRKLVLPAPFKHSSISAPVRGNDTNCRDGGSNTGWNEFMVEGLVAPVATFEANINGTWWWAPGRPTITCLLTRICG